MKKQGIVITGASSGFGALTARTLAREGHVVYAGIRDTMGRNAKAVAEIVAFSRDNNVDLRSVELDVVSDASIETGIGKVLEEAGRLDVIIHDIVFECYFRCL